MGKNKLPKVKEARQLSQTVPGKSQKDFSALALGRLPARRDQRGEKLRVEAERRLRPRFPPLTSGRIKPQTLCNCPRDGAGHFHRAEKPERNEWHMEGCGKARSGGQSERRPGLNEGFQHLRESLLDCKGFGSCPQRI